MEPSEQESLNQSAPTPAMPPLLISADSEPQPQPQPEIEEQDPPMMDQADKPVTPAIEALEPPITQPWQPPSDLPPIFDAHGDEIPFEKLPDLTAEEIIPSVLPIEADEKAPWVERQFIGHLNEMKQWLASEMAAEPHGRIVSAHVKGVGTALDGLIKAVKLVGLNR